MRKTVLLTAVLLMLGGMVFCQGKTGKNRPEVSEPPPFGIYVGIMSFSADTQVLTGASKPAENAAAKTTGRRQGKKSEPSSPEKKTGAFINLNDPDGEAQIEKIISEQYKLSDNFGTALFYAVHKGLADLDFAGTNGQFPENVDSVYIITITDGFDNASAARMLNGPITDFPEYLRVAYEQRLDEAEYAAFVERMLRTTRINGREIHSYSLGLDDALPDQLKSIATKPENVFRGNLKDLQTRLSEITSLIGRENEQMLFSAVFSPPFHGTRLKFEIDQKHYIEGTVVHQNGIYSLVEIQSEPAGLYEPGSVQIVTEGNPEKGSFSVVFTVNKNFPDETEGKLYRFGRDKATLLLDREAQLFVHEKLDPQRKSAIVYFILDSSQSMTNNIDPVKENLISSIRMLKRQFAPITPSGENVMAVSAGSVSAEVDPALPTQPSTEAIVSLVETDLPSPPSVAENTQQENPNGLTAEEAIALWRQFIAEDAQDNPSRNNPTFFQLGFTSLSAQGGVRNTSLQDRFSVPGDITTVPEYWVQAGFFNISKRYLANELLESLQIYFPQAVLAEREGYRDLLTFRIGPFRNITEADAFNREMWNLL